MKTFDGHYYQRLLINIWNQWKGQLEIYSELTLMIIRWSLVPGQFVMWWSLDNKKKSWLFTALELSGYECFLRFKCSILPPCVKSVHITVSPRKLREWIKIELRMSHSTNNTFNFFLLNYLHSNFAVNNVSCIFSSFTEHFHACIYY